MQEGKTDEMLASENELKAAGEEPDVEDPDTDQSEIGKGPIPPAAEYDFFLNVRKVKAQAENDEDSNS